MANFFPRWTNWLPLKIAICGAVIVCGLSGATWYYVTPKYTRVGYTPVQPVPFPHDIHVSQLGMDCRYCHSFVDVAAHSNLPNTQTCINFNNQGKKKIRNWSRFGRVGRQESRSNGCRFIARPITFFTITRHTLIAASAVSVVTAKLTRRRSCIMPNRTAWPGALSVIAPPKIS